MLKEVAVTGLDPLMKALREPSAQRKPGTVIPECLVPAMRFPRLVLISETGQLVDPRIPVTVCREPLEPVVASLNALHWIKLGTSIEQGPAADSGTGAQPAA